MHVALRRPFVMLTALLLALALTACTGGGGGSTPAATSAPAAEAPTRTPRPTREPTTAPEPTTAAEPTVAPVPTAIPAAPGEVLPVQFGDLETYTHPSGVFTIDIPENWSLQDNSNPDEIILVWTDPTRNGGVIVDIFEDENLYSEEELTNLLRTFLDNSFGSQPNYLVDDPVTQNDGSILLVWSYTATADNGTPVDLLGNSFVEQRGNKVSILTTLVPEDQFEDTVERTDDIINTYRINPDATLSSQSAPSSTGGVSLGNLLGTESEGLPNTIVAIGDTVEVAPGLTMTITGVEEHPGNEFFKPEPGNKFLIVRAIFANTGASSQSVSTLLQMSLFDSSGTEHGIDILAAALAEKTADGEVPVGGTLEGGVGFQIPANASDLVFVFKPLMGGSPVGVALD